MQAFDDACGGVSDKLLLGTLLVRRQPDVKEGHVVEGVLSHAVAYLAAVLHCH